MAICMETGKDCSPVTTIVRMKSHSMLHSAKQSLFSKLSVDYMTEISVRKQTNKQKTLKTIFQRWDVENSTQAPKRTLFEKYILSIAT